MTTLDGRKVLVTGASSGIGAATARALAAAGARVALLARSADRVAALAEEVGGVAVPGDITDRDVVPGLVDEAAEGLGGLDGLVNNAGITRPGTIADGDPGDWEALFDVNVLGLLAVTQAAIPHLRTAPLADIVNLSSMSGRRIPSTTGTVYSATKFAVHAITEGLRRELADDGIRVCVLAPGFVADTDIFARQDTDLAQQMRQRQQQGGLEVTSVADQVVHVMSAPPTTGFVEIAMLSTRQR